MNRKEKKKNRCKNIIILCAPGVSEERRTFSKHKSWCISVVSAGQCCEERSHCIGQQIHGSTTKDKTLFTYRINGKIWANQCHELLRRSGGNSFAKRAKCVWPKYASLWKVLSKHNYKFKEICCPYESINKNMNKMSLILLLQQQKQTCAHKL